MYCLYSVLQIGTILTILFILEPVRDLEQLAEEAYRWTMVVAVLWIILVLPRILLLKSMSISRGTRGTNLPLPIIIKKKKLKRKKMLMVWIFFFQKKKKKIANTYLKFVWDAFSKALWTSILKVCFSFFFLGAFGCAAGAFSYATLSNRKNFEADALNPNLYSSLENLKDNRKMENLYDELSKKAIASATVPRRGMQL